MGTHLVVANELGSSPNNYVRKLTSLKATNSFNFQLNNQKVSNNQHKLIKPNLKTYTLSVQVPFRFLYMEAHTSITRVHK